MNLTALNKLRGDDKGRWGTIERTNEVSHAKADELSALVQDLLPTDEGGLVVFGSLARGEFTAGSDLDWTILIDGRADSGHLEVVHKLRQKLAEAQFKVPGPTEVFGGLVFSHELVHAIGGDEDTNKNMTRRLLMLLESTAVDSRSAEVRGRIVNGILNRYVEEDASFISSNHRPDRIPRFLLNDVVRFWRTMAVDYANKYRARDGDKWALRNIKLRMSRKLLFISGFFMCISWALEENRERDDPLVTQKLVGHLQTWTQRPPLESLATVVERYAPQLASSIFDNYDLFLSTLDDPAQRELLERLSPKDAYEDDAFLEIRQKANGLRRCPYEPSF